MLELIVRAAMWVFVAIIQLFDKQVFSKTGVDGKNVPMSTQEAVKAITGDN